ncbi:MAG: hypothetical protein M1833_001672 [Piccolia ochrophora]|nr:MAG: hypothetical protein M1833_001672 [Piccolia ochrophora]
MAVEAPSTFPSFSDGDVIIIVSAEHQYRLHSNVLRLSSTTFDKLLNKERASALTPKQKKEGQMVQYRLHFIEGNDGNKGYFRLQDLTSWGRNRDLMSMPNVGNGKASNATYKHYDNVFKAFYNIRPDFDDENFATLVGDCIGLVDVADYLDCLEKISEFVDVALMRQGPFLYRAIAAKPAVWSGLAVRIRSPSIFKEAIVHLVGMWPGMSAAEKENLNNEVLQVCERKHQELDVIKKIAETKALSFYPDSVRRQGDDHPCRRSYAGDIFTWMAISLFRQWFAHAISEGMSRAAMDGGAKLYRKIAEGGDAYLDRRHADGFLQCFPMSGKSSAAFMHHLESFKQQIKPVVSDLLVSRCQRENGNEEYPYLTCCEMKNSDIPWTTPHDKMMELNKSRKRRREPEDEDDYAGEEGRTCSDVEADIRGDNGEDNQDDTDHKMVEEGE